MMPSAILSSRGLVIGKGVLTTMDGALLYVCVVTVLSICIPNTSAVDSMPINFTIRHFQTASDDQKKPVYLFAHGLAANQQQGVKMYSRIKGYNGNGSYIHQDHWLFDGKIALFDFPDAKAEKKDFHRLYVNLGQETDIIRLDEAYQRTIETLKDDQTIIVMGVSRGAATILNWLALRKPKRVSACIVESAFDCLESVIQHLVQRFKVGWIPLSEQIGHGILRAYFPSVDPAGIVPIKLVDKIDQKIPILFVHGRQDKVVPIKSSRNLYAKLLSLGHKNIYYLELPDGIHGKLMRSKYASLYQNVVHAFFRYYNLPHDPIYAHDGFSHFNTCQPTLQHIQQLHSRAILSALTETDTETIA
jgi:pimeloyl-ACP methyl ester carboxylesterase